ncbi:MAG TPA: sortase, partial [Candidatus Pelethocola excrementipullorum]|nr:sortase [Candidatus Pelethocola excrementipullorum]
DVFHIRTLGKTLAYQVDQIKTALPNDVSALETEVGKDYVTLVTCTPYGVNTHRLLIRGVRIPYEEEAGDIYVPSDARMLDPMLIAPILALPMILIVGICLTITYIIRRRGERV